jgi:hypothetical protein
MAIGLAALGIGLQAYGMWAQGKAAKKASRYNERTLWAAIAEEQIRSEIIADRIRARKRKMEGIQTARYMKAGVKLEGTPLAVLKDTAAQFEEDLLINENDTRLTIARLRMGIGAERMIGKEAMAAAYIRAGATILQGAGSLYTPTPASSTTVYGDWSSSPTVDYAPGPY